MTRNRASAKKAGTQMETLVAKYLAEHLDDRIERRRLAGSKDRGDVAGLRHMGQRIAVEVKNTSRINLAAWATEAEIARGNDDSVAGIVVHKRHGKGQAADQWVTMTLADFVALLTGSRDHLEKEKER